MGGVLSLLSKNKELVKEEKLDGWVDHVTEDNMMIIMAFLTIQSDLGRDLDK